MSEFLHNDENDDAKAISTPRVLSENIRAKNHTNSVNPFPNKSLFLRVCSTSLLKTL